MTQVTTRDGRYYVWNGEKYPSVTTIIGKGLPKPALIRWSAKFVAEAAVLQTDQWIDLPNTEAIEFLAGLPDKKSRKAANLGTVIHSAAEAYSKGEEPKKEVSPQAGEYVDGFLKFLKDFQPKFLHTEAAVFNRTHGYAGTLDSVVRIGRTIWVLDTKTGARIYPDTALQLAAYKNAEFVGREGSEVEESLPKIAKGAILHLGPGTYSFVPVRVDEEVFEAFLSVKDVYNWGTGLSNLVLREPIIKGV